MYIQGQISDLHLQIKGLFGWREKWVDGKLRKDNWVEKR